MADSDGHIDVGRAIAEWREAIGAEHVITDAAALAAAGTTTFATARRVVAVLLPGDRDEVRACLRVADERRAPVFPVSRGRNWGYGSRAPVVDGCAVLDLRRLDRIVDLDARLAHVTVEPGVTYAQLAAFLDAQRSGLFLSVTGGPPDGSVVGNVLERGDGAGPLADHAAHVAALEVMLPTGERVHTGFARWAGAAPVAPLSRWGVGPALDGLFAQAGMGVVTRMTVWLAPLPRHFQVGLALVEDPARLAPFVDALRALRLEGTLAAPPAVWNDQKAFALASRFPWEETWGRTPLPEALLGDLRRRAGWGRWNATVPLYAASPAIGAALRERVAEVLGPVADRLSFDAPIVDAGGPDRARAGPLLGTPHGMSAAGAYWRKRGPLPERLDPEADRCGMLWCTPALPFDGRAAREAAELAERVMRAHGFEPFVGLIGITERLIYLVASILYDRDVGGEDARALACHDALLAGFVGRGWFPFRLGVQSMGALPPSDDDTDAVLRRVKDALDPRRVVAPGRYEPPPSRK